MIKLVSLLRNRPGLSPEAADRMMGIGICGDWIGAKVAVEQMHAQGSKGGAVDKPSIHNVPGKNRFLPCQAITDAITAIADHVVNGTLADIFAARLAKSEKVASLIAFTAAGEVVHQSGAAVIVDGAHRASGQAG